MKDKKVLMTIEDLSLQYEGADSSMDTLALSHVDLTVYEGDFICVLGPSGCGKSTLLNIMAGLLRSTEGVVKMMGEPVTGVDWKRAVVFQTPTLYPWLDVYKNIAFGPNVRGVDPKEAEKRAKDYLELVGLQEFAHAKPYELSGGMRQRVALARALVNEPKMMLMDEPFGALDAFTRNSMQDLIRKIWKETKKTVFLITHDVDEALTLGTRVIAMSPRPGRIVREVEIGFTLQMEDSQEDARYTPEYITLRKEILQLMGEGRGGTK